MTFNIPESAFAPFYQTPVAFYGERAGARNVALTLKCAVTEDSALTVTDSAAPVRCRAFNVSMPRTSWPYASDPEIGEWLKIEWCGQWLWTKANNVNHLPSGDIVISAVQTQEEIGGPPWLT
jgi:hypothetical protein